MVSSLGSLSSSPGEYDEYFVPNSYWLQSENNMSNVKEWILIVIPGDSDSTMQLNQVFNGRVCDH